MSSDSPLPYHFSTAARRRLEQGSLTDLYPGASVYVGKNYKVRKRYFWNLGHGS